MTDPTPTALAREVLELADATFRVSDPETHDLLLFEMAAHAPALARAVLAMEWRTMDSAPRDGTLFLVWAPGREGLPPMYSLCAWHEDAGFCIDELREPEVWLPLDALPTPPTGGPHG